MFHSNVNVLINIFFENFLLLGLLLPWLYNKDATKHAQKLELNCKKNISNYIPQKMYVEKVDLNNIFEKFVKNFREKILFTCFENKKRKS